MASRFGSLFHSLGFRLLVPLVLVVASVLTVHAVFNFRATRQHFLGLTHDQVDRSSELIQRATRNDMLLNNKGDVQEMLTRLVNQSDVSDIRIYDKTGVVAFSATPDEIGRSVDLSEPLCMNCHPAQTPPGKALTTDFLISQGNGTELFRHLEIMPNEPACSAANCHASPEDAAALGVLEVVVSGTPLELTLRSARSQLLLTTIALILVIAAVVAVFVRLLVHRPLELLKRGTVRLADGQLDTRIDIGGKHELARLGRAFNSMAEDLAAAHDEITGWSQQLEGKVVEKTEELRRAQRQVLQMEKMASLGKLSATVAHELNNPLSGILTYAKLVERELADQPLDDGIREELERYLRFMSKECARCGDIVKNLLAFARRSGAKMTRVDLNDVVDRSLMLIRHHLDLSGARLEKDLLADDSEIRADPGQLQQALVALLVNAIEAMAGTPSGDSQLTVKLLGDADQVHIQIGDTGGGIPRDALPHIFEPFFSSKNEESGVGLGLAVVYGIVKRHGGRIEVDSEVGRGTTFHLYLPRSPQTGHEEEAGA